MGVTQQITYVHATCWANYVNQQCWAKIVGPACCPNMLAANKTMYNSLTKKVLEKQFYGTVRMLYEYYFFRTFGQILLFCCETH